MKTNTTLKTLLCALLAFSFAGCASAPVQQEQEDEIKIVQPAVKEEESSEDQEPSRQYQADIVVKDYGTISVLLDTAYAPKTVENFVNLAESGFYDGLTFHRIIDGFMIQGGDPLGNGTGGSDQTIPGEFRANGFKNTLSHTKGVISMARSQDPDSASSQFFIVEEDSPHLDGQYAAFGYVTEGMDIVEQIASDANPTDSNGTIAKEDQPVIETITITELEPQE